MKLRPLLRTEIPVHRKVDSPSSEQTSVISWPGGNIKQLRLRNLNLIVLISVAFGVWTGMLFGQWLEVVCPFFHCP